MMAEAEKRPSERPAATLEPYLMPVPPVQADEIAELVDTTAKRLGGEHCVDQIRKLVESAVLKRGIASLKGEEGKR